MPSPFCADASRIVAAERLDSGVPVGVVRVSAREALPANPDSRARARARSDVLGMVDHLTARKPLPVYAGDSKQYTIETVRLPLPS